MRILINSNLFKSILTLHGIYIKDLAKELGISVQMMHLKINNKYRFNLDDIFHILKILDMKFEEVFQVEKVIEKETAK